MCPSLGSKFWHASVVAVAVVTHQSFCNFLNWTANRYKVKNFTIIFNKWFITDYSIQSFLKAYSWIVIWWATNIQIFRIKNLTKRNLQCNRTDFGLFSNFFKLPRMVSLALMWIATNTEHSINLPQQYHWTAIFSGRKASHTKQTLSLLLQHIQYSLSSPLAS